MTKPKSIFRPRSKKLCPHARNLVLRSRTGAALVEFALVAPLMILFSLGLVEMGRMTMVKQLITNISREGARLATLPDATSANVRSQVLEMLNDTQMLHPELTITPDPLTSAAPGSFITVSISVQSEDVSWLPTPLFMGGKRVTAQTTMRKESL